MDLRIGVINAPREIALELADDTDVAALKAQIADAITAEQMVWIDDKHGRQTGVAGGNIAYVEIGDANRGRMGFASS